MTTRRARLSKLEKGAGVRGVRVWWQSEQDPNQYQSEGRTITGQPAGVYGVLNIVVIYGP